MNGSTAHTHHTMSLRLADCIAQIDQIAKRVLMAAFALRMLATGAFLSSAGLLGRCIPFTSAVLAECWEEFVNVKAGVFHSVYQSSAIKSV